MRTRVTMRQLVHRQDLMTRSLPTFRLEFRDRWVRAITATRTLTHYLTLREMDSWIEGYWSYFQEKVIGGNNEAGNER